MEDAYEVAGDWFRGSGRWGLNVGLRKKVGTGLGNGFRFSLGSEGGLALRVHCEGYWISQGSASPSLRVPQDWRKKELEPAT